MKQIKAWRTKVKQVKFKDGKTHGNNPTSNAFHKELGDMTDKCKSLSEFKKGINELAKKWFPNGKNDLPKDLIQ